MRGSNDGAWAALQQRGEQHTRPAFKRPRETEQRAAPHKGRHEAGAQRVNFRGAWQGAMNPWLPVGQLLAALLIDAAKQSLLLSISEANI
jgi:hypothetical protein